MSQLHQFIFPHENNPQSFNVKELLEKKEIDLVLAEVSEPATGQGIELARAGQFGVPIICIYKKESDISGSLKFLTDNFIAYANANDMLNKVEEFIAKHYKTVGKAGVVQEARKVL